MVYYQTVFTYLLSFIFTAILIFRLSAYLKNFFENKFSIVISLTVLLHPLSIDSFLAPNFLPGAIAFFFLIEGLHYLKKEKVGMALFLLLLSSVCNIYYTFFLLYIMYLHRSFFIHFKKYVFVFLVFLVFYFRNFILHTPHNPIIFLSYFIQNIFLPLSLTVFNYSLYSFNLMYFLLTVVFLLLALWRQQIHGKKIDHLFPLIFLPSLGVYFTQWTEAYRFWHEVLLTPSSYLCITFAFIVMMALYLPRVLFYIYFLLILIVSFDWGQRWVPLAGVIKYSISVLPDDYSYSLNAKRFYAWELIYEKKLVQGHQLLEALKIENPHNEEIKSDLEVFKHGVAK